MHIISPCGQLSRRFPEFWHAPMTFHRPRDQFSVLQILLAICSLKAGLIAYLTLVKPSLCTQCAVTERRLLWRAGNVIYKAVFYQRESQRLTLGMVPDQVRLEVVNNYLPGITWRSIGDNVGIILLNSYHLWNQTTTKKGKCFGHKVTIKFNKVAK